jgi:beta-glucosidase
MFKKIILYSVFLFASSHLFSQGPANKPIYKDPRVSAEKRATDLLYRMTPEEKVYQLGAEYPNANIRLGIPNLVAGEVLHGIVADSASAFPQAIGLASTWDPDLIERVGTVVARESRALGFHHCYAPMLAVVHDARWGRTEESFGEDPYLVSRIGVSYTKGLQGMGKERFGPERIIATAKHFIADGEPLGGLNGAPMELSKRELHEVFLPPFAAAIQEANFGSIMPAHHSLNGGPCHANAWLLKDLLRKELGFKGLIVADNNDMYYLYKNIQAAIFGEINPGGQQLGKPEKRNIDDSL